MSTSGKEIKALWYALRLVAQTDLKVRRDTRAWHRAETLLDDDHNLVVRCEQLSSDTTICPAPRYRSALSRCRPGSLSLARDSHRSRWRHLQAPLGPLFATRRARVKPWCR
jgi:hypothetical protein